MKRRAIVLVPAPLCSCRAEIDDELRVRRDICARRATQLRGRFCALRALVPVSLATLQPAGSRANALCPLNMAHSKLRRLSSGAAMTLLTSAGVGHFRRPIKLKLGRLLLLPLRVFSHHLADWLIGGGLVMDPR